MQEYKFLKEDFNVTKKLNIPINNIFIDEALILEPLYSKIKLKSGSIANILPYNNYHIELYCPKCKKSRIFVFKNAKIDHILKQTAEINVLPKAKLNILETIDYFTLYAMAECNHNLVINFKTLENNEVMKIGQYPSIYDMNQNVNNKNFLNQLNKEYKSYYKNACILHGNNMNIGAMIYLRRIFEKLLIDTFNENCSKKEFEYFSKRKMIDKVKYLKDFLPELLFEQGYCELYKLISNGVHNLTEEQCLQQFNILQLGIEEILTEKIEKDKKKKRQSEIMKELQKISQK